MNAENNRLPAPEPEANTHHKGYDIDQLRYQIVYTSLQRQLCKDKLATTIHHAVDATPFSSKGKKSGGSFAAGSMLSMVFKGLSYADYVIMAYSAFKTMRGITGLFRKSKK